MSKIVIFCPKTERSTMEHFAQDRYKLPPFTLVSRFYFYFSTSWKVSSPLFQYWIFVLHFGTPILFTTGTPLGQNGGWSAISHMRYFFTHNHKTLFSNVLNRHWLTSGRSFYGFAQVLQTVYAPRVKMIRAVRVREGNIRAGKRSK